MTRLRTIVLVPMAAVALTTIPAACGSYSSPTAGSAGTDSSGAGTSSSNGGTSSSNGGTSSSNGGTSSSNGGTSSSNGGTSSSTGGTGGTSSAGTGGVVGMAGTGGGSAGTGGGTSTPLPCDILKNGGTDCVAAHSTVRVIVSGYTGPLYQLCKGTANPGPSSCKGTTKDINPIDGYADSAAHDMFCSGGGCTITKIYDQSGKGNHLEPAPLGGPPGPQPDDPADANALKITINGHSAYGILITPGKGYRTGCSGCNVKTGIGMATGDAPETEYFVTSQKDLVDGCCFDYGNAETSSHDDGNGTMEALYFGAGVVWGTGFGGKPGPWVEADLENGLYAGWENGQDRNISTNLPLKHDFVTGLLLGDTRDKNNGKGRFALYGGDATTGMLQTLYDGIRPDKGGYVPMTKQGSIILGIGGDNSKGDGGRFFEGAISTGPVISKQTADALQAAIVAAKYGQ